MTAPLSLRATAAEIGVHYDTFRKGWRELVRAGFPAPITVGRREKWDADDVAAWKRRARDSQAARLAEPPPANDPHPARTLPAAQSRAVASQRAQAARFIHR